MAAREREKGASQEGGEEMGHRAHGVATDFFERWMKDGGLQQPLAVIS